MSKSHEPIRCPDGKWMVGDLTFNTNAAAWRHIDKLENSPVSRSEDVGDWVSTRLANEPFE